MRHSHGCGSCHCCVKSWLWLKYFNLRKCLFKFSQIIRKTAFSGEAVEDSCCLPKIKFIQCQTGSRGLCHLGLMSSGPGPLGKSTNLRLVVVLMWLTTLISLKYILDLSFFSFFLAWAFVLFCQWPFSDWKKKTMMYLVLVLAHERRSKDEQNEVDYFMQKNESKHKFLSQTNKNNKLGYFNLIHLEEKRERGLTFQHGLT